MSDVNSAVEPMRQLVHENSTVSSAPAPHTLTRHHFVSQDDRPENLGEINLTEVDPFLRGLLFTDGTVTRALEVQALSRVSVDVVAQTASLASGRIASHLDVPEGTESVRRRVAISAGAPASPVIWAESHILPSRLPAGFLGVLHGAPYGIGESLQQVKLESWRDLLWLGLGSPPGWSRVGLRTAPPVITRLYRVITNGFPALLISESFTVKRHGDTYCLDWLT
jgi:chorismate-pyruvate lyase